MIYRVYSDNCNNLRTQYAHDSWFACSDIINIGIPDLMLARTENGLPYLKDILDIGYDICKEEDDIIFYTNTDIGLATNVKDFPSNNFFCVRKNVEDYRQYTRQELSLFSYEDSINCDAFGITKKWYRENRDKIPDFLIGSPTWDLCIMLLIDGIKIDNIIYHIEHEPNWKKSKNKDTRHLNNKNLFVKFISEYYPFLLKDNFDFSSRKFIDYVSNRFGLKHLKNPLFITFYTPSHKELYSLFRKSFRKVFGENYTIVAKEHKEQLCKSASYHKNGWRKTQSKKLLHIINILKRMQDIGEDDRLFVFCDADIVFLNNFIEDIKDNLKGYDLVAQQSFSNGELQHHKFCSGFFAGKPTTIVINFLEKIYSDLISNTSDETKGDQHFLNENKHMLKINLLPERYFSPGLLTNGNIVEENDFQTVLDNLPKELFIVHGNFIVSADSKYKFLNSIDLLEDY